MKKTSVLLASLLLVSTNIQAQQMRSWTMDECIQYAVEHSVGVQQSELSAATGKAELQQATAAFLPNISTEAGGRFNFGRNIDPETNVYNNKTSFYSDLGLYANLTLFEGGKTLNTWKNAKIVRQQGLNAIQKAKDDKAIEVMQEYINVVYLDGCVKLAADKLAESQATFRKTQLQEELGIKSNPELVQVEAQLAEDEYNLEHQKNIFNTAKLALEAAMNFTEDESFVIDTLMQTINPALSLDVPSDIIVYAEENNPIAKDAAMKTESSRLEYKLAIGNAMPKLYFGAGMNTSYIVTLNSEVPASSLNDQLKGNLGQYVGAQLSIPIFSNLSNRTNIQRNRNNYKSAQLAQTETLRQLRTDIQQAVMDRDGYAKEILSMERKAEADSLAYSNNLRKYEEGMMSAIDLQTSGNALLLSRVTLLQKRMYYILKDRLVKYYKGENLW